MSTSPATASAVAESLALIPEKFRAVQPEPPEALIEAAALALTDFFGNSSNPDAQGKIKIRLVFLIQQIVHKGKQNGIIQKHCFWAIQRMIEAGLASMEVHDVKGAVSIAVLSQRARMDLPNTDGKGNYLDELRGPPTKNVPHLVGTDELWNRWRTRCILRAEEHRAIQASVRIQSETPTKREIDSCYTKNALVASVYSQIGVLMKANLNKAKIIEHIQSMPEGKQLLELCNEMLSDPVQGKKKGSKSKRELSDIVKAAMMHNSRHGTNLDKS